MKASKDGLVKALIALNLSIRIYCAFYMIISDCDETFNYWEPLNLLVRGFGKETWEYSPEYAIRSYAYLLPYYLIAFPLNIIGKSLRLPPHYQFYIIRLIALCGFTAYSEVKLHGSLFSNYGPRIGNLYLFLSSIAPGMSHASGALLPSAFAMNCVTIATADIIFAMKTEEDFVSKSISGLTWFILGGVIGWPFTLALAIPYGLFTIHKCYKRPEILFQIVLNTFKNGVIILLASTLIDSFFYKKMDIVPLNIVLYNVFGGEGEGPEIFGVEPFSYYVLNLLVNFNVVFVLSYIGVLMNVALANSPVKILVSVSSPIMLWSLIFGSQPHKEERFLYPIYPLLIVSATALSCKLFAHSSFILSKVTKGTVSTSLIRRLVYIFFCVAVGIVSLLRIQNLVANYSAPLKTYGSISQLPDSDQIINVCTGREWYHFTNSFFLPDNYRLKFVRSGFDGLLPGDFKEGEGIRKATSSIPSDMNNKNLFSVSKLTEIEECAYYIDNTEPTLEIEPKIVDNSDSIWSVREGWKALYCEKIINPSASHSGVGRLVWIPYFLRKYIHYDVKQMDLCSFERRSN